MSLTQFLLLLLAIGLEVVATLSLKLSEGFTRLLPSILVVAGYGLAFYLQSLLLKQNVPVGVIYAIWSGLGTVSVALMAMWLWDEKLSLPAIVGIILVIVGVALINLTTQSAH